MENSDRNRNAKNQKQEENKKQFRNPKNNTLSHFGVLGIIGWSVVTPTVLGTLFGRWLDVHTPSKHSWTISLLIAGLCFGIFTALRWIEKQQQQIAKHKEKGEKRV